MTELPAGPAKRWSKPLRFADVLEGDKVNAFSDAIGHMEITGVTCDSRRVAPGFLFAALPGSAVDGRAFIADAVAGGAAAVIVPDDGRDMPDPGIPIVRERDPRSSYAKAAAAFYGAQPAYIGAVTGTNGKTSVAWFARQLMNEAGFYAASAGTLGVLATAPDGDRIVTIDGSLTTPDPSDLHRDLKALADAGVSHLVIEASSHGLDQRRLDGVHIRACAFTNLTRDHLDYHKTEDAYLSAKLRLFDILTDSGGQAVVNTDVRFADAFVTAAVRRGLKVIRVGAATGCDLQLLSVTPKATGLDVVARIAGAEHQLTLPLVGAFQAANAMVALGLVQALGVDLERAIPRLGTLQAAPGRMQLCGHHPSGAGVYVDFAHTADALETVLKAVRPHAHGRVHVVFGCGGDRDAGKRPEMGKAATANADVVIVTDDNPRTEDAAAIRKAALIGAPGATEIADRREAIRAAVRGLATGDVLVVAGKGHERGQIVGTEVRPFDDANEVQDALQQVAS